MKLFSLAFIVWIISHLPSSGYAQSNYQTVQNPDSSYSFAEINLYGSTQKRTPFWIQANQFGIVPRESPAASLHTGLQHYWNVSSNRRNTENWKIGGGIEVSANLNSSTKILIPQAFAAVHYGNWELYAGRKKQWVGLADSTLGMGSYSWSGNALPIPKIQFGTTRFISVPLTDNWVAFNAFYSEGIFENNRPVTHKLKLHQKALYVRLGKPTSMFRFYGGFNHQVQWGGQSPFYTVDGQMPKGLKSYFYIITGKPHATGEKLTHFDQTSRIGNHLGSIDLALEVEIRNSSLFFYRQNIYEDGSLYYFNNIDDGLNGIRFRRKPSKNAVFQITEALVEFLYTKSQGGPVANADNNIRGKDDYFNNGQVRDGWSYYDRTIGTPFITPTSDTKGTWPNHSDFFTNNNRVSVWNFGLRGNFLDHVTWSGKFSYSQNYGTYDIPFEGSPKQYSALLNVQIPTYLLGGTTIKASLAADLGDLYAKTYGFSVGIRKEGLLNIKGMQFTNFRY